MNNIRINKILKVSTEIMNKYIISHFYMGILPAIYLFLFYIIELDSIRTYEIKDELPIDIVIAFLGAMFIPALIWLMIIKYLKKIKHFITITYFLLFLCGEITLNYVMLLMWGWRM